MNRLANRFLVVAVITGACGMGLGLGMGVTGDFTLAPAHAHLNLLGWVSMFLYSLFYQAVPGAAAGTLPRLQFWLSVAGVVLMFSGLAATLLGRGSWEPVIALGAILTITGLVTFAVVALRGAGSETEAT